MDYIKKEWPTLSTEAEISTYNPVAGIHEYHVMIKLTDTKCNTAEQFQRIETTIRFLQKYLQDTILVWTRFFVSDAVNQSVFINSADNHSAVSIVQQPPLDGTKVAVWLYFVSNGYLTKDVQGAIMEHSAYRHLYHTQIYATGADVVEQTETMFEKYIQLLSANGCTLEKHCQRTWVFAQGVDTLYQGMVAARRKCFEREGLTKDTHYIASTGIEGKFIHPDALVFLDAYSVQGVQPGQIKYLYASTHLNPTSQYGVTFERGTSIQYGDRRHVYISGTASINNRGEIEHPLDLIKQADRMFENIRSLLAEAETDMNDVAHLIVYLRDMADYSMMASYMKRNYPCIPQVIVWAPVCRPGWLVEAECMAVKCAEDKRFKPF